MRKNIRMGLDCSTTSTGYAIFNWNKLLCSGTIKPNQKLDWRSRIQYEWQALNNIIREYKPNTIYVEDVPLKDGKFTIQKLSVVQGIVLSLCAQYSIDVQFLLPSEWRGKLGMYDGTNEGKQRAVLKRKAVEMANNIFHLNLCWNGEGSKKTEDDRAEAILICYSQVKDF